MISLLSCRVRGMVSTCSPIFGHLTLQKLNDLNFKQVYMKSTRFNSVFSNLSQNKSRLLNILCPSDSKNFLLSFSKNAEEVQDQCSLAFKIWNIHFKWHIEVVLHCRKREQPKNPQPLTYNTINQQSECYQLSQQLWAALLICESPSTIRSWLEFLRNSNWILLFAVSCHGHGTSLVSLLKGWTISKVV